MGKIISLMSLILLMSCGKGSKNDSNVDYQAIVSSYENLKLSSGQSLEATALFKVNPCTDNITGSAGAINIDGHSFTYASMTSLPISTTDCKTNFTAKWGSASGWQTSISDAAAGITHSGDYTVIVVSKDSGLVMKSAADKPYFTISPSDSGLIVVDSIDSTNPVLSHHMRSYLSVEGDFKHHQLAGVFEFDKGNEDHKAEIYSNKIGHTIVQNNINPLINGSTPSSPVIAPFSLKNFKVFTSHNDESSGLYYMAVIPSLLSPAQKVEMVCYGMYIAAKAGNPELLYLNRSMCGI